MGAEQGLLGLPGGPLAPKASTVREREAYFTPADATRVLIERAPEVSGQDLLDPCCGDGRMAQALLAAGRVRTARLNDLAPPPDTFAAPLATRRDAADPSLYLPAPAVVCTNPPFAHAGAWGRPWTPS